MYAFLSWLIGVNGGILAALAIWVATYHIIPAREITIVARRTSWDKMAYALSYAMSTCLLTTVAIWDMAHPAEQFPFKVRMVFTLSSFVLGYLAMIPRVLRRNPR